MPDRRAFLGTIALLAAPRPVAAQPTHATIGVLNANSPLPPRFNPSFFERLRELGWREGQNLRVELRGAGAIPGQALTLAAELVRLKVDILVMDNGTAAREVVEKVTRTVPICVVGGDLQAVGVVRNLARPEGNVTGVQVLQSELAAKRLEILKEVVPTLARVGVLLRDPGAPTNAAVLRAVAAAGRTLGVHVDPMEALQPSDFDRIFSALSRAKASGLLVTNNPITTGHQQQIIALAAKARIPTMFEYPVWTAGPRPDDPAVAAAARRPGDSVTHRA
jgi:putative ABC transport system substrate-binding protein